MLTRFLTALSITVTLLAAKADATTASDTYVQQVTSLVSMHQSSSTRLAKPATATAQALIGGGNLSIANNSDSAWVHEALSPAGGLMFLQQYDPSTLKAGSVVWLSYTAKSYMAAMSLANTINQMKGIVVAFGPQPPAGPPGFTNWIDSLTSWTADDDFTLLGNVLSLWTFTGEVAAATSRQGNTLVFSESPSLPGSDVRNADYHGMLFHKDWPKMSATQPGVISGAYLGYISAMLTTIKNDESAWIAKTAQILQQRMTAGTPAVLTAESRLMPYVPSLASTPLVKFVSDLTKVSSTLGTSGYLVHLGYDEANLELWRTVRLTTGGQASWINVKLPTQADLTHSGDMVTGDIVIDEHWDFGDCTVEVPDYDVRILPASGVAQLFIYELLLHAN